MFENKYIGVPVRFSLHGKQGYVTIQLLPPQSGNRKGVCCLNILFSFILSVLASVAAYYICKWLDGEK